MTNCGETGPVRFIRGENGGRYPFCNSVYVEGPGILIDPASDQEALVALRDGPGVSEIWLSHWHEDHFTYLNLFEDVPLRINPTEAAPLGDMEVFMDWYGIEAPEFRDYWRKALVSRFNYKPRRPDGELEGGEMIGLGGLTARIILTPGHTPGHLSFFFEEPGVLYMGDYDLTKFGPWYGDRDSDIDECIGSVKALREIPARAWMTGHEHGLFLEDPGERWDSFLRVIDERDEKLFDFIAEPRSMDEIVERWIVYRKPREPRGFFEYGERALMGKHLERMIQNGRAVFENGRYARS